MLNLPAWNVPSDPFTPDDGIWDLAGSLNIDPPDLALDSERSWLQVNAVTQTIAANVATMRFVRFDAPVITAASAKTVTSAATCYVSGAPSTSGSATITNPYAFWVDAGASRFDGKLTHSPAATSGTPATATGCWYDSAAATYTDSGTAASGTNANLFAFHTWQTPTLAASNANVTTTWATTGYMVAPTAGTNNTITNKYALILERNSIGETFTADGGALLLRNTTAATGVATEQNSPAIAFEAQKWDTELGGFSESHHAGIQFGTDSQFAFLFASEGVIPASYSRKCAIGLTGITIYNVDDAADYEWGRAYWDTNVFYVVATAAGTGTVRPMTLSAAGTTITQPVSTSTLSNALTVTQATLNAAVTPGNALKLTAAAHGGTTPIAASVEAQDVYFDLSRTVTFATGALTTQRAVYIDAPTYAFAGASTITTAATVAISGAPIASTNATITKSLALSVESGLAAFAGGATVPVGAKATGFKVYNTADETTNSEYLWVGFSGNNATLGTVAAGSGTLRALVLDGSQLYLATNGTARWAISTTTGHLLAATDNVYDNGAAAYRTRDLFLGRTFAVTQAAVTTAANTTQAVAVTGAAHTGIAASTEVNFVSLNLAQTYTWQTGAITTQRAVYLQAPTYAFVAASTITTATTFEISGAPAAGANATITNAFAFNVAAGNVAFRGGQTVKRTAGAAATVTVAVTDYYIGVTYTATGAVAVNLPAAATCGAGKVFHVKDEGGNAQTNNITIDGNAAETIDGAATKVISTNYGCYSLITDGSNWFVF